MKKNNYIFCVILLLNFFSIAQENKYNFKEQSTKVIDYYEKSKDQEKIKAAKFILDNIHNRKSEVTKWFSSSGKHIKVNENAFDNFEDLKKYEESLKLKGSKRILVSKKDDEYLNAEFLIDNIDHAFKTWRNSPWHSFYSFETFCNYILPYRNGKEPVRIGWRKDYNLQYRTSIYSAEDNKDPVSVLSSLVDDMKAFDFKLTRENPQSLLSLDQIDFRKEGSCPDLANSTSMIARSLGIATTFDFTPYHAASSNAHFWNTVVDKDGNHIPFCANQNRPNEYDPSLFRRIGKALRITFSEQKNTLSDYVSKSFIPNENLALKNAIDVTAEYTDAYTLSYKFEKPSLKDLAYICVFNKGKWRPTWWSKVNGDNEANFTNMGGNLIYLPASIEQNTIQNNKKKNHLKLERFPVLLKQNGSTQILKPNFNDTFDCQISRKNEVIGAEREFNTIDFQNGSELELQYWDKDWQKIRQIEVINDSICLENLPSNTLFRLIPKDPDNFERIFLIEESSCKIYWY